MKTCSKCSTEKLDDEFGNRKDGKGGKNSICKLCENKRKKQWRGANAEHHRKRQRDWHEAHHERGMHSSLKWKSKKLGIPFNIDVEDIVIPNRCPVLGIPLRVGKNGHSPNSPTVDRIVPHKGYTKGNVWVISHRANAMKQDASPKELVKFAEWALKKYAKTVSD